MSHALEKMLTLGVGETLSCWWFSQFICGITALPWPHPQGPSPVPEDTKVRAFPASPWGAQMENEDQPWRFHPLSQVPRSSGLCRTSEGQAWLTSFPETGSWGTPCSVGALTLLSQATGPEIRGVLTSQCASCVCSSSAHCGPAVVSPWPRAAASSPPPVRALCTLPDSCF